MDINYISDLRDKNFFHDFHMMFDEERIGKLKGFIRLFENIEKFWELIEFLLEYLYLFLEEEHFCGFQKESRYELIHQDKEVKRMHVHLFLPAKLYRRLKLIHQDLNFYSIAQIVRMLINRFLMIAEEYGERLFEHVKELQEKWDGVKAKMRKESRSLKVRQLSGYKGNNNIKTELITVYTKMFLPFAIYLL